MSDLDRLYVELLNRGVVAVRNAAAGGDLELCRALSEYLHEVPSLIGETNTWRHAYQATAVRLALIDWAKRRGRADLLEFVDVWLASIWISIDEILGTRPTGQPAGDAEAGA